MTETLLEEWGRLAAERRSIQAAMQSGAKATPEQTIRHREIQIRIVEIIAIPPDGYALPKIAADLVAHAAAHGWSTLVQWTPEGVNHGPFVDVTVGRKMSEAEIESYQCDTYLFKLTYHSQGCEPGKVKKFGAGLAKTPDKPQGHDAPSVKKIREVIAANPVPEACES